MTSVEYLRQRVAELEAELESYRDRQRREELNLELFDEVDFDAVSAPDWPSLRSYLPDLRITEHSLKVAHGDWTAVVGRLRGTFSQPLKKADGSEVPPTGRAVDVAMATFARWENDRIAQELLFWDTGEFARQLGL
ncbi:ester cyclase [Actinospica robiniae]|uniref:ester cyclase n=1 Tax=Actinospica robiniae TaxID=304901 RepID=UPI00041A415C|nr:ester cyclase [Actinospica robiniae]